MQWTLVVGYTFLILAILPRISFFNLPSIPVRWLQAAFIIKVLAGIALGIIYSRYYTDRSTADTFKFFDDSQIIFNALKEPGRFFQNVERLPCKCTGFGKRVLRKHDGMEQ